ncbi:pentapeptide repeat-containing protein [Nocardia nova]|uniref:pentapeptide repeat-containing protein n=1 Tax=Nocardia nova TaxID=37330 RepID=UPI0033CE9771
MLPMWMLAVFWLIVATAFIGGLYLAFRAPSLLGGRQSSAVQDALKLSLTCAAAAGTVLAGVYAYRKQQIEEASSRRADDAALNLRFTSASDQLGSQSAAVRLAGAYAMASLADDWIEQRQMCVNVICAYLRMENQGDDVSEIRVREAITSIIRERTQIGRTQSWSALDYDLTGAHLHNLDLSECVFSGKLISFSRAVFSGILTTFEGARFESERTSFSDCAFTADNTRFNHCTIAARQIWFERLDIRGRAWLDYLHTSGEIISFADSKISGDRFSLAGANLSSNEIILERIQFTGERAAFSRCTFGGATSFRDSTFTGTQIWFEDARLLGPSVSFEGARFENAVRLSGIRVDPQCDLSPGPLDFPVQ